MHNNPSSVPSAPEMNENSENIEGLLEDLRQDLAPSLAALQGDMETEEGIYNTVQSILDECDAMDISDPDLIALIEDICFGNEEEIKVMMDELDLDESESLTQNLPHVIGSNPDASTVTQTLPHMVGSNPEAGAVTENLSTTVSSTPEPNLPQAESLRTEQESILEAVSLTEADCKDGETMRDAIKRQYISIVQAYIKENTSSEEATQDAPAGEELGDKAKALGKGALEGLKGAGKFLSDQFSGDGMKEYLESSLQHLGIKPSDVLEHDFDAARIEAGIDKLFPDESVAAVRNYETVDASDMDSMEDIEVREDLLLSIEPWADTPDIEEYKSYLDDNGKMDFGEWYDNIKEKPGGIFGVFASRKFRSFMHSVLGSIKNMEKSIAGVPILGKLPLFGGMIDKFGKGEGDLSPAKEALDAFRNSDKVKALKIRESWGVEENQSLRNSVTEYAKLAVPGVLPFEIKDGLPVDAPEEVESSLQAPYGKEGSTFTLQQFLDWTASNNLKDDKQVLLNTVGFEFLEDNSSKLTLKEGELILNLEKGSQTIGSVEDLNAGKEPLEQAAEEAAEEKERIKAVTDLIGEYGLDAKKFDVNDKDLLKALESFPDGKKEALKSLNNLPDKLWNGYLLTASDINLLGKEIGGKYIDNSETVFHVREKYKGDYIGRDGKRWGGGGTMFEIDGSGRFNDWEAISVKGFLIWLRNPSLTD